LDSQTVVTCLDLNIDGEGFGIATHCGRANLSKISYQQGKHTISNIMTFKGQKSDISGHQNLYPVTAVGFNPRYNWHCFTTGADGILNFWDYLSKSRTTQYSFNGRSISCARASTDGKYLAYGLGYEWSQGINGYGSGKTSVGVHPITSNDLSKEKKM
jgi:WD40 repeat protein